MKRALIFFMLSVLIIESEVTGFAEAKHTNKNVSEASSVSERETPIL